MTGLAPTLVALRASFWFIPAMLVLASMVLAVLLIELDAARRTDLAQWSSRLFGASAQGSRAMLSAIATSMITVAGVVFSITIVTLSQASAQYSPRVLRNFMSDRPTQAVLGVFVGVFAYCLVVLRTIRGADEGGEGFVPSVSVLGAMVYAFVAIAVLIYFIHHLAQAIQASSILERIDHETCRAIDDLFPDSMGQPALVQQRTWQVPQTWSAVNADRSGYVVRVDAQGLLRYAIDSGRIVRLPMAIGDFVSEGALLLELEGTQPVADREAARLRRMVHLGRQRTIDQDAGFGLQQLVDVAVKAESPGINDPTTAVMCIDRLGALLTRLAGRQLPDPHRAEGGRLRVIAPAPEFHRLLELAFGPVLAHSRGDLQVLGRVAQVLPVIAAATDDPQRRVALLAVARQLREELRGVRPCERAEHALQSLGDLEGRLATVKAGAGESAAALARQRDQP